jgi:hypothetical protein
MKGLWISLGAALLLAQPALAQKVKQPNKRAEQNEAGQSTPSQPSQSAAQLLRDNMQKSGFTKVQVVPESFLIRAIDPQGNPIAMIVSPDMVAGVAVQQGGNSISGRSVGVAPGAKFAQGPIQDATGSKFEGTTVWSEDNQQVGDITGIGIGDHGSLYFVLSRQKGGDVAVNAGAMALSYNEADNNWNAKVNATASQIDSAPQVQYNGK